MNRAKRSYRSSGLRGFSPEVDADPGRVFASKIPGEVPVQFAPAPCTVRTREGLVQVRAGDAILTGPSGERWRVTRARFGEKYQPVPPTREGQDGRYAALPIRVAAVRMHTPFEVVLVDGKSVLTGAPGDWLVDYGDGSFGVIAAHIFATTYRIEP